MIGGGIRKNHDMRLSHKTLAFLRDGVGPPREFLDKHYTAYVGHVKNAETRRLSALRPMMDAIVPGIVGRASRLVRTNRFRPDPLILRGMVWIIFQHRASQPFEDRSGVFLRR